MKKHLLSQAAALCLLAPAASLLSLSASAAPNVVAATVPQAHGLEVNADNGVAPGSQLRLTLDASPGGQATARIPGLDAPLVLKEVSPGRYTGRYTVRGSDRIDPSAVISVSFTAANRTVVANYTFPTSFMQPVASAAAQPTFTVQRPIVIAPGVVLRVPMRETRPGHYEGSYTLRRQDNLGAAGLVTATLRSDDNRVVTATLSQPLVNDNRPPQIGNLSPRQGEAVSSGPTLVSGSFDDASGAGVDPQSVRIFISGRDVSSLAQVTPREFSVRDRLPPGRHTVEVVAADRAGNVAQRSWSFDVGSAVLGAPSVVLPLMVMSHQNNAVVDHNATTIRGRTAPFATVTVRVDAIAPLVGRRVDAGVAQRLLAESVQADANGDFSFIFSPRQVRDNASTLPVPGTRYDVSISANRDNLTSESRLILFQRG